MFSEEDIAMMDESWEYFGEKMYTNGSIRDDNSFATTGSKLRASHWSFMIDMFGMTNIYFLYIHFLPFHLLVLH